MPNNVTIDFPASYRFLGIVSASIDALLEGLPDHSQKEGMVFQVKLAVQEACTNIIDHAYGHDHGRLPAETQGEERIEANLLLQDNPCQIRVDLYDSGHSFFLPEIRTPNQGDVQEHGYGLFLIHELMNEVRYEPSSGQSQSERARNHWRLVKEIG